MLHKQYENVTLCPLAVEFWRLLMTFANNLDPDEAPQKHWASSEIQVILLDSSGPKLFANLINSLQNSLLAGKELICL